MAARRAARALRASVGAAMLALLAIGAPALAQGVTQDGGRDADAGSTAPSGHLLLRLRALEPRPEACRLRLWVDNASTAEIAAVGWNIYVLGTDPASDDVLNVQVSDLGAGDAIVLEYDLPGADCASIERVHLNRLRACDTRPEMPDLCWADLEVDNLTARPFGRRGG
ncbi:MAG: hypothetical protein ACU0CO_14440 [Shimia sp.]